MIEKELFINELTSILVRTEGTLKILEQHNVNPVLAHRKVQGIKDKLVHLIIKLKKSDEDQSQELLDKILSVTSNEKNH
jgi:uncharacterized protein (UPF0335 family)